jgi:hypothetical protein
MAQTTTKSVAAKKTAALPKTPKTIAAAKKTAAAKPVAAPSAKAKKPVAAKSASAKEAAKAPAKKAAPAKPKTSGNGEIVAAKKSKKAASLKGGVTPEQRYQMICDAAYFRAERRGFIGGNPEQDWVEAELEIDQLLCDTQLRH